MKTSKGTVALENRDNRIRLRWSASGKRYSLALGLPYTSINVKAAQRISAQIELDIASGNFDQTLEKYRINQTTSKKASNTFSKEYLLPVWDKWVSTLSLSTRTLNGHYKAIRTHIEKANPKLENASWYEEIESLSPKIFNDHLGYLRKCIDWAVEEKLITSNPYTRVKRRKVSKQTIKPFNAHEISAIITAFRTNQYCPRSSAYKHSHYADYVEVLFLTGCRPSEVIGLQRKHIDFDRNEVVICSVLARGDKGETNGAKRVRKETKTGSVRYLTMSARLRGILESRCKGLTSPEALVFTSPMGNPIDDRMFLRRQWKVVLKGLGIEYRKPYTTRHTLASVAIEQGIPLTSVAYLLGHADTSMVSRVYGHMINRPALPEIEV